MNKKGAKIDFSDPFVNSLAELSIENFSSQSIELNKENIKKYDITIITTDHDIFDFEFLQKNASIIIDSRGVYKEDYQNVIKA